MTDRPARRFFVTGGAGFIGSAVVRHLIANTAHEVVVVDKLTYAGNLDSLAPVAASPRRLSGATRAWAVCRRRKTPTASSSPSKRLKSFRICG